MRDLHVVFGMGPVGRFTAESLLGVGKNVRLVSRRGAMKNPPAGVECLKADVFDAMAVSAAVKGASVVYQCAQPAYGRWTVEFPPFQEAVLNAAASAGADLVLAENLYGYGDRNGEPMTESSPLLAVDKKGATRARMSDAAFAAHGSGRLKVAAARASDFYGPYALEQSPLGARSLVPMLSGKPAMMMGNVDVPHTYTYVKDFGKALALLGTSGKGWGRAWHVPSDRPEATAREALELAAEIAGVAVEITAMGRGFARILSPFVPILREFLPLFYQVENPYVLDSRSMQEYFELRPTPMRQALEETIAFIRTWQN